METAVSYLKVAIPMLQTCNTTPIYTMGLLNAVMTPADHDTFNDYMKIIYFAMTCNNTIPAEFITCLSTLESEYMTLYRAGKWTKSKQDPSSGFYVNEGETRRE